MTGKALTTLTRIQSVLTTGVISSDNVPMPFTQDIFLLECHVAGTAYQDLEEVGPQLKEGQMLTLRREPGNEFDDLAIEVFTEGNIKLGYVPRAKNEVLSRLMDAGRLLFATIIDVNVLDSWLMIDIEIYLQDL